MPAESDDAGTDYYLRRLIYTLVLQDSVVLESSPRNTQYDCNILCSLTHSQLTDVRQYTCPNRRRRFRHLRLSPANDLGLILQTPLASDHHYLENLPTYQQCSTAHRIARVCIRVTRRPRRLNLLHILSRTLLNPSHTLMPNLDPTVITPILTRTRTLTRGSTLTAVLDLTIP